MCSAFHILSMQPVQAFCQQSLIMDTFILVIGIIYKIIRRQFANGNILGMCLATSIRKLNYNDFYYPGLFFSCNKMSRVSSSWGWFKFLGLWAFLYNCNMAGQFQLLKWKGGRRELGGYPLAVPSPGKARASPETHSPYPWIMG